MILVTGATGRIGRELTHQLAKEDVPLRAFIHNPDKAGAIADDGVELFYGDMRSRESCNAAVTGIEKVFLLSREEPQQTFLQANIIEAAAKARVQHIVKVSSIGANLESSMPMARWHAETEHLLTRSGIAYTILRPNYFMQNLYVYLGFLSKGALPVPMGNAKLSILDLRDIAAVAKTVLLSPERHHNVLYDLTGPESVSFSEIAGYLSAAAHKQIDYVDTTPEQGAQQLSDLGLPPERVSTIAATYKELSKGIGSAISNTVSEITHQPSRTIAWFADEIAALVNNAGRSS